VASGASKPPMQQVAGRTTDDHGCGYPVDVQRVQRL
jgi:hypothetical protein